MKLASKSVGRRENLVRSPFPENTPIQALQQMVGYFLHHTWIFLRTWVGSLDEELEAVTSMYVFGELLETIQLSYST